MFEFVLPDTWSAEKKEEFERGFADKALKKLEPLIQQQQKKDREKEGCISVEPESA